MLVAALLGFFALIGGVSFEAWPHSDGAGSADSIALAQPSPLADTGTPSVAPQPQPVLPVSGPPPTKHDTDKRAHEAANRAGSSNFPESVTASESREAEQAGPGHSLASQGPSAAHGHAAQRVSRSVHPPTRGSGARSRGGEGRAAHGHSQAGGHSHATSHLRGHSRARRSHGQPSERRHSAGGHAGH